MAEGAKKVAARRTIQANLAALKRNAPAVAPGRAGQFEPAFVGDPDKGEAAGAC
jgi:hypothetical protein